MKDKTIPQWSLDDQGPAMEKVIEESTIGPACERKIDFTTKRLWKFKQDFGRMGEIESVFIAHISEVRDLIGKTVFFGEILGKHSDIHTDISKEDFTVITENQEVIEELEKHLGTTTISGYNPINYYNEQEQEDMWD